jgi:hypothetical protein
MHWLGGPWTEVKTGKLLDVTIDKRKNDSEVREGQVDLEDRVKCLKAEYERKQNLRLACLVLRGCRRQ